MLKSLHDLPRIATFILPIACAFLGCMSSTPSSTSSSGAGGAGGAVLDVLMTTSGPGGPSVVSASSGTFVPNPPLHCSGDAGAWDELTAGPIPCQSGEQCCVIMDPCLSRSQVVAEATQKEASEAWPTCPAECTDCIPRAIDVACIQGSCLGRVVEFAPLSSPLRKDHCGTMEKFHDTSNGPIGVHFSCGPGPGP